MKNIALVLALLLVGCVEPQSPDSDRRFCDDYCASNGTQLVRIRKRSSFVPVCVCEVAPSCP